MHRAQQHSALAVNVTARGGGRGRGRAAGQALLFTERVYGKRRGRSLHAAAGVAPEEGLNHSVHAAQNAAALAVDVAAAKHSGWRGIAHGAAGKKHMR